MSSLERVQQILDEAVGGPEASVTRPHGPFWRRLTRDEFVNLEVRGFGEKFPLIALGDGSSSNLIKALKGEAPFGSNIGTPGARMRRMPSGGFPVSPDQIAFIEKWIDDGCPDDDQEKTDKQWRPTNAPEASSRTDDIWFVDASTGWAVNSNGQILKTSDGGQTWTEQFQAGAYLRCLGFATPQKGWVGTLTVDKRMLHTSDGGQMWSPVENLPAAPIAICGLSVVSEAVVYASGTNFPNESATVIKTSDGGETWIGIDMEPHASLLIDCYFIDDQRGWVVGGKADIPNPSRSDVKPVVLYTDDGGQTWENRVADIQSEFPLGEWGWKIQFLNESVGVVALENFTAGAILKTTDGGHTWTRKVINDQQGNANLEGIGFIDENHGWVGGWGDDNFEGGFSSETFDGGDTWQDANHIGRFINRFRFFGDPVTVGYASGRTVYKYSTEPVSPVLTAAAPAIQLLETNEPAEFVGPVEIIYTVPKGAQQVEINIWDRFGAHIRKLVDESPSQAGPTTAVWDRKTDAGQPVSSGSFIYRLTIDGQAESRVIWLK